MAYKRAPAMINRTLSKSYDAFVNAAFVGTRLQKRTLSLVNLEAGDNYLDIGCATGTLAILVKAKYKNSNVSALDPDKNVLEVARRKASNDNLLIDFVQSGAESLPLEDGSQNVITSSLAFHHMPTEIKLAALSEIKRVLKKDGSLILVDIGKPKNKFWKLICGLESLVEPKEYLKDNLNGDIPHILTSSGFRILKTHEPYMGIYTWECAVAIS